MNLLFALMLAVADPEQCLAPHGAITVTHGTATYTLASEECREQFLSDPERYAQLYDALLELRAAGAKPKRAPSLVPS
ncbi:MAG TPA: hypothetical protein VGF48_25625 [Thermoanaerobaculia bacterium]|jgi:hypothetical protein